MGSFPISGVEIRREGKTIQTLAKSGKAAFNCILSGDGIELTWPSKALLMLAFERLSVCLIEGTCFSPQFHYTWSLLLRGKL